MRRVVGVCILGLALALTGCTTGLIYTHITTPLDINFNNTPVFTGRRETGKGDTKKIQYYVAIEWESNAIGDIMKKAGLKEVYYADLEILSVLGIWTQRWVNVYGR